MTFYKAIFMGANHSKFKNGQVYEVVLAENPRSFEMRQRHNLHAKTQHNTIESLLNTWGFIIPVQINNSKL